MAAAQIKSLLRNSQGRVVLRNLYLADKLATHWYSLSSCVGLTLSKI